MAEVSIKVSIANRQYPLKIQKGEEGNVDKAVMLINDKLKEFEKEFGVMDKQDFLAMCALELAVDASNREAKTASENHLLGDKLGKLNELVSGYLQKNNPSANG